MTRWMTSANVLIVATMSCSMLAYNSQVRESDERRWVSLPKFGTFAAIGECMY